MIESNEKVENQPPKKRCACIILVIIGIFLLALATWQSIKTYYSSGADNETPLLEEDVLPSPPSEPAPPQAQPQPEPDPTPEVKAGPSQPTISKEKMIDFFIEVANTDDSSKSFKLPIYRWNESSVPVGLVEGQLDQTNDDCLNNYINDFNSLSNTVTLVRQNNNPKISLHYLSEEKYQASYGNEGAGYGFEQGNWDHKKASYIKSDIYISAKIKNMNASGQCQVIRHELTHAVGFWGHSDVFPESIMSLPKTSYNFPEVDKRLIQLMYNIGLPAGSEEAQVREYLNANYPY